MTAAEVECGERRRGAALIAVSDNSGQIRSHSTEELMAACAVMQRFGEPGTPTGRKHLVAWLQLLPLTGHRARGWEPK